MTKSLLLLFSLLFLMIGCAITPSAASQAMQGAWLGGNMAQLQKYMGPPEMEEQQAEGLTTYRWKTERTTIGPPRHDFGPRGQIKLRPGVVEYQFCQTKATADPSGRIVGLTFSGHCPIDLLPPWPREFRGQYIYLG